MSGDVEARHLRALVALTEEGTFTDAAIRLGITQSAISRTIAALESAVGVVLVERTTRSVALTDAGARTYRAAVQALAALDDVVAAAHDRTRPLRLGYSWSALGRHTTVVLQRWRTERPDVPLEVHRIDELDAGLARGRTDIVVVRGPAPSGDVHTRQLFTEPRVAALPAGHRLARATSVRLADLVDDTVLITTFGTTTLELWPQAARPRSAVHVDNTDEWLTEIAGGTAIGVTAASTSQLHTHLGVTYVPITDAPDVPVHLVWPAHRAHPAVPDFVELVALLATG